MDDGSGLNCDVVQELFNQGIVLKIFLFIPKLGQNKSEEQCMSLSLDTLNNQQLCCLVYASRATQPFDEADLRALLQKSRFNNSRDGISGMLTYVKGMFFQMLEGPEDRVEAAYRRISSDPRHDSLRRIQSLRIEKRHFPQWTMGFPTPNADMLSRFTGYTDLSQRGSSDLERLKTHDSGIFKIMCDFGQSMRS